MGLMSSVASNLLAGFRPTGCPTFAAPPSRTASTKLGSSGVPSTLLKTEMQPTPHGGVAARAAPGAAALTHARHVSEIGRARLNSSHANISYAVFCLKKKTI